MKKSIFMGFAAMMLCGSVYATSWRVCTKPEAGANFLTVAEAVASNSVFAGDTLYVEPGHVEQLSTNLTKALVLIGPGYMFPNNNLNMMDVEPAIFNEDLSLSANSKVYGLQIRGACIVDNNCVLERCRVTGLIRSNDGVRQNVIIRNCFLMGNFGSDCRACYRGCDLTSSTIEGNIMRGATTHYSHFDGCTFRNNTVIVSSNDYIIRTFSNSDIYNNIIINTSTEYSTNTNQNQTVDTTYESWNGLEYNATNNVHHNILSNQSIANYSNCIFNVRAEDVLVLGGNDEAAYMHKTNGLAVGAGVGGSTCGAYGSYGGDTRPYSLSGIPYGRPYIYDANIDDTPSSNNTINASFKIKVQQ